MRRRSVDSACPLTVFQPRRRDRMARAALLGLIVVSAACLFAARIL